MPEPSPCLVCAHPDLAELDAALVAVGSTSSDWPWKRISGCSTLCPVCSLDD